MGVVVFAACGAPAAGPAPAHPAPTTTLADELEDDHGAGPPRDEPLAEEPDAGPRCVPSASHECPPVRGTPSILLDPDLTPTDGGFPALSADRATLAVARIDADGGRGAPNLTIVLVRVSDGRELRRLPILEAAEGARIEEEGEAALADTIRARVRSATAELTRGRYESLDGIDFSARGDVSVTGDARGLHLAFDAAAHTIVVRDATRERGRITVAVGAHPTGAWTDLERRLLVVHLEHTGTDTAPQQPAADVAIPLL